MADSFLGEIRMFAGTYAPRGWAFCNGQLMDISQNAALFSLLGTTYGGDGRTTFGLPDLRGRAAIHFGNGPGLNNYRQGQRGGAETITLAEAQMPSHAHTVSAEVKAVNVGGNQSTPGGHTWAADPRGATNIYSDATPDTDMNAGSVAGTAQNAGGSQAHENRPPYLAINFIISLAGMYPSRS